MCLGIDIQAGANDQNHETEVDGRPVSTRLGDVDANQARRDVQRYYDRQETRYIKRIGVAPSTDWKDKGRKLRFAMNTAPSMIGDIDGSSTTGTA